VRRVFLATLLLLLISLPAHAAPTTTFTPPYSPGPHGGDQYNWISTDPTSGRVSAARAYPYPGAFNCAGSGGYAYLRLRPVVTGPVSAVTVDVSQAATDAYTWISLLVRDGAGRWLGGAKLRGPVIGSARLRTPLAWTPDLVGHPIVVDIGLELASACPNADGGTASFRDVVITGSVAAHPSPARAAVTTGPAVVAANFAYNPADPSVPAGAPLLFANGDAAAPHTLTSVARGRNGLPLFDTGTPISAGQVAVVTGASALAPGTYPFYCKVHTEMRGVLTVTA
jgi:plastocyanin